MTSQVAQYVGVAATTTQAEVSALLGILDEVEWPSEVKLMNGPLVSRKTLSGQAPDNPAQYPPIDHIARLLIDDPRLFNVIHFNSRDPRLINQLTMIVERMRDEGGRLDGIQLNIMWPCREQLEEFNFRYPELNLILQLSRASLDSVGGEIDAVVECLSEYSGLTHYVLYDPSGGTGQAFQGSEASLVLRSLMESGLPMHWGVTGGLQADRAAFLRPLLRKYPGLCFDAQSRLRDGQAGDTLSMEKCFAFLASSSLLLRRRKM